MFSTIRFTTSRPSAWPGLVAAWRICSRTAAIPLRGAAGPASRCSSRDMTWSTCCISCKVSNAAGTVTENSGGLPAGAPSSNSRSNFLANELELCSNWPDSSRLSSRMLSSALGARALPPADRSGAPGASRLAATVQSAGTTPWWRSSCDSSVYRRASSGPRSSPRCCIQRLRTPVGIGLCMVTVRRARTKTSGRNGLRSGWTIGRPCAAQISAVSSFSSYSTACATACWVRTTSTLSCSCSSPISSSESKLNAEERALAPAIACANSASSACGYDSHSVS